MDKCTTEGRLYIGIVAKCQIIEGQELFFDYGIQGKGIPWLKTDAKKIGITVNQGTSIYELGP